MLRVLLLALFCVAPLAAADYEIKVDSGVGEVVAPPYTRFRVAIARTDPRPFVGRVVVELSPSMGMPGSRRRGPRVESGAVTVVQDVTLAEGAAGGLVTLDVPISGMVAAEVRLERQVTGDYYDVVALQEHSPAVVLDDSVKLVGFVSNARLKVAQDYLFHQLVEIPVADLPDSWKPLAGFDAIVLNDDRLTRAQSTALIDYMAAGGTLILSPTGPASFNPETPAGSLLRIPATTRQSFKQLRDFGPTLTGELKATGMTLPGSSTDGMVPVTPQPAANLVQPPDDTEIRIWPDSGRAKPVPETAGLVSIARVGAGNLVLLHADISAFPLAAGADNSPTTAGVKLLDLATASLARRAGNPLRLLADPDVRDTTDIAGKRIPGRDALVIILLLYIAVAGVGMFVVARRIRKPELYPATLFAAALVSVILVFGLGEIYKRSGDRVKAVRILVSDETTDRNAIFSLGCAYAVEGEHYDFVNSRKMALLPAKMEGSGGTLRGNPADTLAYTTAYTAGESGTRVRDLDRWQNVFFMQREPVHLENFTVDATSMQGAVRLDNRSPHELKACVFLVGATNSAGLATCEWHYAPRIGAGGSADASITFSESTRLHDNVQELAEKVATDTDDLEREALGAMFTINREDRRALAVSFKDIEQRLHKAGLMPEADEFLLLAVLPKGALSGTSLGAAEVEEDDIGQVALWAIRGGVEGR